VPRAVVWVLVVGVATMTMSVVVVAPAAVLGVLLPSCGYATATATAPAVVDGRHCCYDYAGDA